MPHNEHNKTRGGGSFTMIIIGAILLILAPNINQDHPELGMISFVGGAIIGGIGFYFKFIRSKVKT